MSDPGPARLDSTPAVGDPEEDPEGHVVLRTLKRVRSTVVLVPLLVGVLVAASIGANKLWADLPESTLTGPDVTCWDGRTAPLPDCGEPRGKRGLRWVFPSYRPDDERCAQVRARAGGKPLDVACTARYDQRSITITYAARADAPALLDAVRTSYGNRPVSDADGERIVFRDATPDEGLYRTTVVYADHPFAVTVEAPTPDLRDDALGELVTFRPADQVVVRG